MLETGMLQPQGLLELQRLINIQPGFPSQLYLADNLPQNLNQALQRQTTSVFLPTQVIYLTNEVYRAANIYGVRFLGMLNSITHGYNMHR